VHNVFHGRVIAAQVTIQQTVLPGYSGDNPGPMAAQLLHGCTSWPSRQVPCCLCPSLPITVPVPFQGLSSLYSPSHTSPVAYSYLYKHSGVIYYTRWRVIE
jgi:hypothetical protein